VLVFALDVREFRLQAIFVPDSVEHRLKAELPNYFRFDPLGVGTHFRCLPPDSASLHPGLLSFIPFGDAP
jgi:hypothetical protein